MKKLFFILAAVLLALPAFSRIGIYNQTNGVDSKTFVTCIRTNSRGEIETIVINSADFQIGNTNALTASQQAILNSAITNSSLFDTNGRALELITSLVVVSNANIISGVIATNGQILTNSGNYFVPSGASVSIRYTNAGTLNVYGDGTISSNYLGMGANVQIKCRDYCPNGGQTLFNLNSNWWMSVTCKVVCVTADINDQGRNSKAGLPLGIEGGNTTNQADFFEVMASSRINFYEWETKRSNPTVNTNFPAPLIRFKTSFFDASYCVSTASRVETMNFCDGSLVSADEFYFGVVASASPMQFQVWPNWPGTNCIFTLDVGRLTASPATQAGFTIGFNADQPHGFYGIVLSRVTDDADQISATSPVNGYYGTIYTLRDFFSVPIYGMWRETIDGVTYSSAATGVK